MIKFVLQGLEELGLRVLFRSEIQEVWMNAKDVNVYLTIDRKRWISAPLKPLLKWAS